MIDEEKYKAAVAEFMKNPSWAEEYNDAPTELSQRYKGLDFYFSEYIDEIHDSEEMQKDLKDETDRLEQQMGLEDWEYLLKHCGNNPFKAKCKAKVAELKSQGDE